MELINNIIKTAKHDELFKSDVIDVSEKVKVPGFFSGNIDKAVFASVYYGWLSGRYGVEFADSLNGQIILSGRPVKKFCDGKPLLG